MARQVGNLYSFYFLSDILISKVRHFLSIVFLNVFKSVQSLLPKRILLSYLGNLQVLQKNFEDIKCDGGYIRRLSSSIPEKSLFFPFLFGTFCVTNNSLAKLSQSAKIKKYVTRIDKAPFKGLFCFKRVINKASQMTFLFSWHCSVRIRSLLIK